LGSIIDARRYREQADAEYWDSDHHIPERERECYHLAQEKANETRQWLFDHFELHLENAEDGLSPKNRLRVLSERFLVQQCKTLVYHKFHAEQQGIYAEDHCITAQTLKDAIEMDFGMLDSFCKHWLGKKKRVEKGVEQWLEGWINDEVPSYAWKEAPEGGK
jgi:hypothetical protein